MVGRIMGQRDVGDQFGDVVDGAYRWRFGAAAVYGRADPWDSVDEFGLRPAGHQRESNDDLR